MFPLGFGTPRGPFFVWSGSHSTGRRRRSRKRYTHVLGNLTGRQVVNMGQCSFGIDQVALAILQRSKEFNPKSSSWNNIRGRWSDLEQLRQGGNVNPRSIWTERRTQIQENSGSRPRLFRKLISSFMPTRRLQGIPRKGSTCRMAMIRWRTRCSSTGKSLLRLSLPSA